MEGIENRTYNGQQQKQTVKVTLTTKTGKGKDAVTTQTLLVEEKDYTVTYSKNTNAGTASMVITGTGIYTGKIRKTFKILPYDMTGETNAEGKVKEGSLLTEAGGLFAKKDGELKVKFAKGGSTPAMTLLFNGKVLTAGKDYAVKYTNNKAVTTAETKKMPLITITGKGNLKGKVTKTFAITGKTLTDAESAVSISVADKAVSSKAGGYISKPVLTDADGKVLKQGKDYTTPVYTTTDVSGQTITLDKTSKVEAGKTVTVTVEGTGAYAGAGSMLSASYRITDKNFGSIKCRKIEKTYTGREVTLTESDFLNEDGTGKITFKDKSGTTELKYGVDFEIVEGSYKKNIKKGTASVTLKGLGAYGGTKTITFKIKAKGLFL